MPQFSKMGSLGRVRPTASQIRSNIIVVPKAFINRHRQKLRWFHAFTVDVLGNLVDHRKRDLENRIGGLRLRDNIRFGDTLQLGIVDGTLVITKFDDPALDSDEAKGLLDTKQHAVDR